MIMLRYNSLSGGDQEDVAGLTVLDWLSWTAGVPFPFFSFFRLIENRIPHVQD